VRARPKPRRRSFTRRAFLKGIGLGGVGATVLAGQPVKLKQPDAPAGLTRTLGPGAVSIALKVNGVARTLRVEPRVTLLDALRDRLDLTGSKKICDRGECGGCAVLVDGRPALACMMLAVDARHRAITTVEGLAAGGRLHPVQAAFIEADALQCGFCTPGFVVAAKALLDEVKTPSAGQVREALSGHLCRCGTYPRVVDAVLSAAGRKG